jgi:VanZ family protein
MVGLHLAHHLKVVSRFAAWFCLIAVAVLSLTPSEQMLRTGLSGHVEHVLAYAGTAFITALAFAERGLSRIAMALLIYAGGLEFLQRFSPGRTSSIWDFMFSSAGVLIGAGVFALLARAVSARSRGSRHRP